MLFKLLLLSVIFMQPAEVTAYCGCESCCGEYSDGITASGHVIRPGDKFVAAPKTFAFGTIVYIPGYGIAEVRDRGGAIQGNRWDVYFSTHKEALEFGRRKVLMLVFPGR